MHKNGRITSWKYNFNSEPSLTTITEKSAILPKVLQIPRILSTAKVEMDSNTKHVAMQHSWSKVPTKDDHTAPDATPDCEDNSKETELINQKGNLCRR